MNNTALAMTAPTPHYAIILDLEGHIRVNRCVMNDAEEQRLDDWINHQTRLRDLLDHAVQLADGRTRLSR